MNFHSSRTVAKYLLEKAHKRGLQLTPMQLLKLVYIAHGWMLGLYSRPLIKDDVEAWEYGPVVRDLYRAVKKYRHMPVQEVPGAPDEVLDEREENLIDQVLDIYGDKHGLFLSSITHAPGTPWHTTWHLDGKNGVISNDLIENHYATMYQKMTEENEEAVGAV